MYTTSIGFQISKLTYLIASCYLPHPLRSIILYLFAKVVKINLKEAEYPLHKYTSINHFFTRALKPSARTITPNETSIISPVDGKVLEYGSIKKGTLLQAKNISYTVDTLIPTQLSTVFKNGSFICIYLSPADCHRIFTPYSGDCIQTCHVPGALYPVREPHISQTQGLYTKNERLISILATPKGKIAIVMVGAINVGKISVTYATEFQTNLKRNQNIKTTNHFTPKSLKKGAHLGTFHLGSTVILCTEKKIPFDPLTAHQQISYGQAIGSL